MQGTRLLIVLIFAQVLAMAGFANFAVLLPEFTALWMLTNTQAGWISGIFFVGYVLAVPVLVGLTDAVDAKRVYVIDTLTPAAPLLSTNSAPPDCCAVQP